VDQLGELAERLHVLVLVRLGVPHDPEQPARLGQLLVGAALDGEADRSGQEQLEHVQALRGQDRIGGAVHHQQVFEDVEARLLDRDHPRAAAGADLDQPLLLELLQRLAHRSAVRPHPRDQVALRGKSFPGPVAPTKDLVAELVRDVLGDRGAVGHRGASSNGTKLV
jgi:hypothetical protein